MKIDIISDEDLTDLTQAINNRYGLDFTNYERTSLKRGIIRLMHKYNMKSIIELWSVILRNNDFFLDAIDDLLVNLTELFRNPDAWIKLRDMVIPEISNKSMKIWHAGCSTGEEVYTMNIVLETLNLLNKTRSVATDLSAKALNKAKKGDYSLIILKQYLVPFLKFFPDRDMEDYFDFQDKHATIKTKV